jgi:hypothetical protein
MTGISRVAEKGSASQERVCCMMLVTCVLILTEEFVVDLGSCLRRGKPLSLVCDQQPMYSS